MSDIEKGGVEATTPHHTHLNGQSAPAPRPSTIANPATLGLFSFASTTFMLSMYNCHVRDINHPNVVLGMAIFCGGLAQLLAGMWEFPKNNTFGAAAFSSYGAFWMSYATILIPGSGVLASFGTNTKELQSGLGIYLTCWCMVTAFYGIAALGKHWAFVALFGFLTVTYACLAAGEFNNSLNATKAGGVLGVITAFIAYYIGLSELLATEAQPIVRLPLGIIHRKKTN
ncbi:FUN34 transmembrane protein [Collybia nuda]|uniref:FUN34 transmembrane protein n=1 Tax=Collybia nuda TaxID=64659 RepID=A0A9P6CKD6_9AGAR|nr:FUN34 transmembrane protein [Collybia nuda]